MIHHVSIPARDPQHVATVLAELMGGKCHPFGPLEGAFMAASGDGVSAMLASFNSSPAGRRASADCQSASRRCLLPPISLSAPKSARAVSSSLRL